MKKTRKKGIKKIKKGTELNINRRVKICIKVAGTLALAIIIIIAALNYRYLSMQISTYQYIKKAKSNTVDISDLLKMINEHLKYIQSKLPKSAVTSSYGLNALKYFDLYFRTDIDDWVIKHLTDPINCDYDMAKQITVHMVLQEHLMTHNLNYRRKEIREIQNRIASYVKNSSYKLVLSEGDYANNWKTYFENINLTSSYYYGITFDEPTARALLKKDDVTWHVGFMDDNRKTIIGFDNTHIIMMIHALEYLHLNEPKMSPYKKDIMRVMMMMTFTLREQIIYKKILEESCSHNQKDVILVIGSAHKDSMSRLLKSHGITVALESI